MIPSVLSSQVQKGVEDFLKTTFPVSRTIIGNILPDGPQELTYTAPFELCDREIDYATALAASEKRGVK